MKDIIILRQFEENSVIHIIGKRFLLKDFFSSVFQRVTNNAIN